jgi:hypothetical protein
MLSIGLADISPRRLYPEWWMSFGTGDDAGGLVRLPSLKTSDAAHSRQEATHGKFEAIFAGQFLLPYAMKVGPPSIRHPVCNFDQSFCLHCS